MSLVNIKSQDIQELFTCVITFTFVIYNAYSGLQESRVINESTTAYDE